MECRREEEEGSRVGGGGVDGVQDHTLEFLLSHTEREREREKGGQEERGRKQGSQSEI